MIDHENCRCPCTCGHAHDKTLPVGCTFCRALATYKLSRGMEKTEDRTHVLYELAKDIRETNEHNCFDRPTWNTIPAKIMFAVTELNEGMDAILGVGEDPLTEELADTAIRILDILYSVWGTDWADRTLDAFEIKPEGGLFEPGEVALWKTLRLLCRGVEAWRYERRSDVRIALELALRELFAFGIRLGVDLIVTMRWKNDRNAGRGVRHGKARAEG